MRLLELTPIAYLFAQATTSPIAGFLPEQWLEKGTTTAAFAYLLWFGSSQVNRLVSKIDGTIDKVLQVVSATHETIAGIQQAQVVINADLRDLKVAVQASQVSKGH